MTTTAGTPNAPMGTSTTADRYDDIRNSLMGLFKDQLSQNLQLMEVALTSEDWITFADLCHKCRGSAATFGYRDIGSQMLIMEDLARSGEQLPELRLHFKLLQIKCREILKSDATATSLP